MIHFHITYKEVQIQYTIKLLFHIKIVFSFYIWIAPLEVTKRTIQSNVDWGHAGSWSTIQV